MNKLRNLAKKRVLELIEENRSKIVEFLREYVRHKSINLDKALPREPGNVKVCQKWLAKRMQEFGCFDKIDFWEVEKDRPNLAAILRGTGQGKDLMFNGHTDVVPVIEEQAWVKSSPWSGQVKAGKVWGRGSCDMKGGNTASIWAAKSIHDARVLLKGNTFITIDIGEESAHASIGVKSILDRGYTAPFVVSPEPTDLVICPVSMGLFCFKLTVYGKGITTAFNNACLYPTPYGIEIPGVNAIDKALKLISAFSDLNRQWGLYRKHPLMQSGDMNSCLTLINGGQHHSSLPSSCTLRYVVSFMPSLTSKEVILEIKKLVENVVKNDYWLSSHPPELEIPYLELHEPVNVSSNHEGCQVLSRAFHTAIQGQAKFGCFPTSSDVNFMFQNGLTAVNFGPGSLANGAHGPDEFVTIDQLIDACKTYACMMIDYCDVAEIK